MTDETSTPSLTSITSSLLARHWKFAAALYVLLLIPDLLLTIVPDSNPALVLVLRLVKRIFEMGFLSLVSFRVLGELRSEPLPFALRQRAFLLVLLIGLLTWAAENLLASPLVGPPGGLLIAIPLLGVGYLYYFYFFPIVCSGGVDLRWSASIVRSDRWLPVKVNVAPVGFWLVIYSLFQLPYPDWRLSALSYASVLVSELTWALGTFFCLAAGILSLDDMRWRECGFDPYRSPRLATIEKTAPASLVRALRPVVAWQAVLAGMLFSSANLYRLYTMPPAPQITFQQAAIENNTVQLSLHLSDPVYHFNSFQPFYFNLAGEKQRVIAHPPQDARIPGNESSVAFAMPSDLTETDLTVSFTPDRPMAEVAALDDLHLWYRSSCVLHLSLKDPPTASPCVIPQPQTDTGETKPE